MIIKSFCSEGMSTSLLANKMQDKSDLDGLGYTISAHGISDIVAQSKGVDLILLASQISYMESNVRKEIKGSRILIIDRLDYGRLRVDEILKMATIK